MKTPTPSPSAIAGNIFPAILNTFDESLFLLDNHFKLTWYNKACDRLYRSVSGRPLPANFDFNELLTSGQQPLFKAQLNRVLAGEKMCFEWNYQKAVSRWLVVSIYPFTADDGRISGICGSLQDITEKKCAEHSLLLKTAALDSIGEAVVMVDAGCRVLTFNKRAYSLLKRNDFELCQGCDFANHLTPDKRTDMLHYLQSALQGKEVEYEMQYPCGTWLMTNYHPVRREDGSIEEVSISITDSTERRQLEEERLQDQVRQQKEITRVAIEAQEAERNQLGRELHDNINQLLATVSLQLSYCLGNYSKARPVIKKSQEHVMMAIEEIRCLSHKMVTPRFSYTSLRCELNELIMNYKYAHAAVLEASDWDEQSIPHNIKETLFRIAQEQLNNVYKHAKAKQVTVHIRTDAGFARMSVIDDGVGFDPCEKKNGIGLSNIINRAEAYHGFARFISAPGQGCTLTVCIPYASSGDLPAPVRQSA